MVRSIVGANWGDEGKGKITDVMAENSDIVVRFQGGANAGHTIINDYGKFALHLLPSGVFHSNIVNVIGPGVALDVERFMEELNSLVSRGVPMPKTGHRYCCPIMWPLTSMRKNGWARRASAPPRAALLLFTAISI